MVLKKSSLLVLESRSDVLALVLSKDDAVELLVYDMILIG